MMGALIWNSSSGINIGHTKGEKKDTQLRTSFCSGKKWERFEMHPEKEQGKGRVKCKRHWQR